MKVKAYYMDKSFFLKYRRKVFKLPLSELIDFPSLIDELNVKKSTAVREVDWSRSRKLSMEYVNPVILDKFCDKTVCRDYVIEPEIYNLIDTIVR